MENHKNTINELNNFDSNIDKFYSLKDIKLPYFNGNRYDFKNNNDKLCVVYCVWANKGYIKFLYLSILSQLQYSDITNFDIRIFVTDDLYDFVVKLFEPLFDTSKIIKVPLGMAFKYGISTHPELQRFQVINFTDTDGFVHSENKDVYSKIYHYHKNNPNSILMCNDNGKADDVFDSRREDLTKFKYFSYNEYLLYFKTWFKNGSDKIEYFLHTKKWFLSCHFSYNRKIFDNYKFNSYVGSTLYHQFGCDETVWIMYAIANSIDINKINVSNSYRWVAPETFDNFLSSGTIFKGNSFIHPIAGIFCK
ncbi:MAG: hypothetical protein KC414_09230, partial [Romboutsia sp.]|nr:hypothetical protein [Romboutsia sp.]